jgi:hypothetical protein
MAEDKGPEEGTIGVGDDRAAVVLVPAAAVGALMYPAAVAEILRVPPANDLQPQEDGA